VSETTEKYWSEIARKGFEGSSSCGIMDSWTDAGRAIVDEIERLNALYDLASTNPDGSLTFRGERWVREGESVTVSALRRASEFDLSIVTREAAHAAALASQRKVRAILEFTHKKGDWIATWVIDASGPDGVEHVPSAWLEGDDAE